MAISNVVLLAPGAITSTSTGTTAVVVDTDRYNAAVFQLDVTAAATAAGDTLDMFVQTTVDGTNWLDVVHFTQVLGNGGAKRFVGKITRDVAETMYETGTALGAAAVRNVFGNQYRVRYTIATATAPSFTVSVRANFI